MINQTIAINRRQFILAWLLWLTVIGLLVGYLALVGLSILYLVEREETERRITRLETDTSALVADYLEKTGAVDLELAYQLGFESIAGPRVFAVRQPEVVTLSWLDNEI